jgi:hypothetical protein
VAKGVRSLQQRSLRDPTLLPTWPESDKLTLVCAEYHNDGIAVSVIESQAELEEKLKNLVKRKMLFFEVLKSDFRT